MEMSAIQNKDQSLSIRLDPICICGRILFAYPNESNSIGHYTIVVHCDNPQCTQKHINKTIEINLE